MKTRITLVAAFVAAFAAPAFAHAFLQHASPAAGDSLAAPKQIALTFSEKLEPHLSGASVTDPDGHDVGTVTVNDSLITVALPALKPGTYRVDWHAVSVDTHRTEGSYRFTVTP